jgi:hypothetical protein
MIIVSGCRPRELPDGGLVHCDGSSMMRRVSHEHA